MAAEVMSKPDKYKVYNNIEQSEQVKSEHLTKQTYLQLQHSQHSFCRRNWNQSLWLVI